MLGFDPVRAHRAAAGVARALPARAVVPVSRAVGVAVGHSDRRRRRLVERNLRRVVGGELRGRELRRMVDATFASYARYYAESFRLPSLTADTVIAGMTQEGFEHVEASLRRGIGPIIALPHLGGWEWGAFWLTRGPELRVTAVAELLEPPELFEWFVDLRAALGINVVPLGPSAGAAVSRAIRDGHVVCLLSDRDITGTGVEVEFFGERTTLPAGPAMLALRTGAPLLPTAVYFRGQGHHGVVRPPVPCERRGSLRDDVARVTQVLAAELEVLIRTAPEQWHLLQPNWPSDRALFGWDGPHRAAAEARGARQEAPVGALAHR